jgi:hypothetical protein
MGLKSRIVRQLNSAAYQKFAQACAEPEVAQERVWQEIQTRLQRSEHWREQSSVWRTDLNSYPLTTYEDYRASLSASFDGSISRLTGEKILYWCRSSGTTAASKLFPLTPLYVEQLQRTTGPYAFQLCRHFPKMLQAPILYFAGAEPDEFSPAGIETGFISRFVYQNLSRMVQRSYALPREIYQTSETLYEFSPLYCLGQDLCAIMVVTPAHLLQILKRIQDQYDDLYAVLSGARPWPKGLPSLKVSAARLELLRSLRGQSQLQLAELWPSLQVITTWKSSTAGLRLRELAPHLQRKVMVIDGHYSATEGWMTVPLMDEDRGTVFHPGAHIVEFLPVGQSVHESHLLKPWQLEPGQDYEIFLTTAMGFVRYRLFDVVRCRGFWKKSPRLEFRHKAGHILSLGSTRFSEEILLQAMDEVDFIPDGPWAFAPNEQANRLCLYTQRPQPNLVNKVQELDKVLCRLNPEILSDYKTGLLEPLELKVLHNSSVWDKKNHSQSKQAVLMQQALNAR